MRRSFTANTLLAVLCIALAAALLAQSPKKPFQSQSLSTINYSVLKDGEEIADITNVSYDLTGDSIPGRPPAERLVLRKTTHLKQVIGDKGLEAKATVAAWPLGADLKQKPLYSVDREAVGVNTRGNALLVFARGLEEVEWWSVHKLGGGQFLFDTYAPLLEFSTTTVVYTPRYVGF